MKFLVILLICWIIWLLFFRKKKKDEGKGYVPPQVTPDKRPPVGKPEPTTLTRHHTRLLERKTFIRGRLLAKYYGELDSIKDLQDFVRERYYDFTLYDAEIKEGAIRLNNEGPFPEFADEDLFPGPIQPNPLPCSISVEDIHGPFQVQLHDVKLAHIDLNKHRLLHQLEGDEVFGTLEAEITGYVLEQFEEHFETTVQIEPRTREEGMTPAIKKDTAPDKTDLPTGRTKTENGYRWTEYWYSDRSKTYWGKPEALDATGPGSAGVLGMLFMMITGAFFLAAIGPHGIMVLLVLAAVLLLVIFFSPVLRLLLWIGLGGLLIFAVLGVISMGKGHEKVSTPGASRDEPAETSRDQSSWTNTRDSTVLDSVIIHHRVWKDYNGKTYAGDIAVRINDWKASTTYKNMIRLPFVPLDAYDGMLAGLAREDSGRLGGVYHLLDSIKGANHLGDTGFAQVVTSFVQDIPYALVLDGDCDPSGYNDAFTKRYLLSPQADCEGHQRFGINSPVEFMATLKGDCDTRTLLLYTLLEHYGYAVAILSSELYAHSLLGIDLPLGGVTYARNGHRYVLWETTSAGIPPGVVPSSINDLSHWRISLTAKK